MRFGWHATRGERLLQFPRFTPLFYSLICFSPEFGTNSRSLYAKRGPPGAHQMERPSLLISWVNPFPSRFINMTNAWIIEWIMLEFSNEFCWNHRMKISWIIEWILLALFHKCRRESNAYQGEFIEFCYNYLECISKMKYIWILLSICGNYQTHISLSLIHIWRCRRS